MTDPATEKLAPPARARPAVVAALAAVALVLRSVGAPAASPEAGPLASASNVSRWWKLACDGAPPDATQTEPGCIFSVRLRGRIDGSRLRLIEHAIERRDAAARALRRDVALRVDADSSGGEVFAGMEIGRRLRGARASFAVADGSTCISACVFALMGAVETEIAADARVGVHRPSLGAGDADRRVGSMTGAIELYASEMGVSRALVDAMMAVPSDRIRLLSAADLARYGIAVSGASPGSRPAPQKTLHDLLDCRPTSAPWSPDPPTCRSDAPPCVNPPRRRS